MPATVIIASREHLPVLQQRADLGEHAVPFADDDALLALDTISSQRPSIVAIERGFAATSRGAALINRIKADPALVDCEIRVIAHDSDCAQASPRGAADATAGAPVEVPGAPAPVDTGLKLDLRGTRRAPRFRIVGGVEAVIDGTTAAVLELSVIGAKVLSPTILRPNQRVRFTLADVTPPVRCRAIVAWAAFEMPGGTPRYRAGLELLDVDAAALGRVIEAKKASDA